MNNCTPYDAFLLDSLFMLASLLGTALLFALAGYYLGKKSNKNKNNDSKLIEELEDCKQKYNQLKISSTTGKIDTGISSQSSDSHSTTNFQNVSSLEAKTEASTRLDVSSQDVSNSINTPIEAENSTASTIIPVESATTNSTTTTSDSNIEELKKKLGIGVDANPNINTDIMKMHFGSQYGIDDLKIVEGIGPKIAQILNDKGINTWKELSVSDPENIRSILLEVGGAAYKIHEPSTWPKQALLAHEGKFEELKNFQDELKGGRI